MPGLLVRRDGRPESPDGAERLAGLFVLHPTELLGELIVEDSMYPAKKIGTRCIQIRLNPSVLR